MCETLETGWFVFWGRVVISVVCCPSPPQIFFSFLLTPLFKKPKFASTVGSMLTVVFGCMSLFTVLMKDFPQPLVWLLCLLSPSAFSIGIAQVASTRHVSARFLQTPRRKTNILFYTSGGLPGGAGGRRRVLHSDQRSSSSVRPSLHALPGLCALPSAGYLPGPGAPRWVRNTIKTVWVCPFTSSMCGLLCRWFWTEEVPGLLPEAVLLVQTQEALRWSELSLRRWSERRSRWWGVCRTRFPRVQRERSYPVKIWFRVKLWYFVVLVY